MSTQDQRWLSANACRGQLVRAGVKAGLTREEAAEAASEAILRAAGKVDLDPERVHSWLKVVARNLAIDILRERRGAAWLTRLAHCEPEPTSPCDRVDDVLEAAWVAQVVAELPMRQRLVLEHRASGHSPGEIAKLMNCTYRTVESLTSRARTTVRKALTATLAVLAASVGCLRRSGPAAAVPAVALVSALAVGLPPLVGPLKGDLPPTEGRVSEGWTQVRTAGAVPLAHDSAPTSRRPERVAGPGASLPKQQRDSAEHQRTGALDSGIVSYSGMSHTRTEGDRTLTQSVIDCLERGVEVTAAHIGCREQEGRRNSGSRPYGQYEATDAAGNSDVNPVPGFPGTP